MDGICVVVLIGVELKMFKYVCIFVGVNLSELLNGNFKQDNVCIIFGDVLFGQQKGVNSYLNFYDDQIIVIIEGDYFELFGWLFFLSFCLIIFNIFLNFFFFDVKFDGDINIYGEKCVFVVMNDYEQVMLMDIYI